MNYLSSLWTQRVYPADKKWLLWANVDMPKVNLYTDKAKQRGVIKEDMALYRVVVQETETGLKVVGVYPRSERSGQAVQGWLARVAKGAIPKENIIWQDDAIYEYT